MTLRAPQAEAIEAYFGALVKKKTLSGIISLPTGVGKTRMAIEIVARLGWRCLWLTARDELVQQPYETLMALYPEAKAGIIQAELDATGEHITFASVDTLRRANRLARFVDIQDSAGHVELIIIDECHHAISGSGYETVLNAFPDVPRIGLTATPERADGRSLMPIFTDGIIYRYQLSRAIADGFLVPPIARRVVLPEFAPPQPKNGVDLDQEMLAEFGRLAASATARAVNEAVAEGRKVLGFTVNVEHARCASAALRTAYGISADYVSGDTPGAERAQRLSDFRSGKLSAILNCSVLTEGYDDPTIDAIVVARPTRSRPFYIQMVGRGLRTCDAKKDCLVLDLVGAHASLGLVTADTLLLPNGEEAALVSCSASKVCNGDNKPSAAALSALKNFLSAVAGDVIGGATNMAMGWLVAVPGACLVLPGWEGNIHAERMEDGTFTTMFIPRERKAVPVRLANGLRTLQEALEVGEYESKARRSDTLASRDAQWRNKPASDKALMMLAKWGQGPTSTITAGEASDIITCLIAKSSYRARKRERKTQR